nr:3-deoxy-8-phosphooctulonate synthase [Alphaproteobacteria bacterium]
MTNPQKTVAVPHLAGTPSRGCHFANDKRFTLIAGPCTLESLDHAEMMQGKLLELADQFNIGLIYKSSFDKANRTSIQGVRGIGIEAACDIFA